MKLAAQTLVRYKFIEATVDMSHGFHRVNRKVGGIETKLTPHKLFVPYRQVYFVET